MCECVCVTGVICGGQGSTSCVFLPQSLSMLLLRQGLLLNLKPTNPVRLANSMVPRDLSPSPPRTGIIRASELFYMDSGGGAWVTILSQQALHPASSPSRRISSRGMNFVYPSTHPGLHRTIYTPTKVMTSLARQESWVGIQQWGHEASGLPLDLTYWS